MNNGCYNCGVFWCLKVERKDLTKSGCSDGWIPKEVKFENDLGDGTILIIPTQDKPVKFVIENSDAEYHYDKDSMNVTITTRHRLSDLGCSSVEEFIEMVKSGCE